MVRRKPDKQRKTAEAVCRALRAARIEQGLSQKRLAELAGLSRTGLRHIESLETSPTLYSLLRVAKALGDRPPQPSLIRVGHHPHHLGFAPRHCLLSPSPDLPPTAPRLANFQTACDFCFGSERRPTPRTLTEPFDA
jgi:transcriptional regulator with XRE-family HTH domain